MTTTAVAKPPTPHDIHHHLLTEAEQVAHYLTLPTLQLIRRTHRQRFPDCPAARREGVNQ